MYNKIYITYNFIYLFILRVRTYNSKIYSRSQNYEKRKEMTKNLLKLIEYVSCSVVSQPNSIPTLC